VPDAAQLADAAARVFAQRASEAIAARGVFRVALSGGSTPRALYRRLATMPVASASASASAPASASDPASASTSATSGPAAPADIAAAAAGPVIDWAHVQLFFGDERHVPPDHPDSNYRMVKEALLAHAPIPDANVYRIRTELPDAGDAAADYAQTLRRVFDVASGEWPRFDLVLLGLGPDGHTASLFPDTPVLHERSRMVAAVWVASMQTWRVTLTPPVLNHARTVLFLVSGAEKAETVHAVLEGPADPERLPAQLIAPSEGAVHWLLDAPAASRLTRTE
jgi:6-phosphogluconolactonase